jgi:catechol 2,3-dioxygenase-like lactoylglutathione lyase family enzyme
MAQLLGPDFVALQVRDLQASRQFYKELLGLALAPQSAPNAVVFATKPIPFALRAAADLDLEPRPGAGVALWFLADNADALHVALAAAGVTIARPPHDGSFGRTFAFVDPDGYVITVHSN